MNVVRVRYVSWNDSKWLERTACTTTSYQCPQISASTFSHIKYASKTLNANSLWQKIWSVWPQKTKQCKVIKKPKKIARLVVVVVAVKVVFIHWILSKDTFIKIAVLNEVCKMHVRLLVEYHHDRNLASCLRDTLILEIKKFGSSGYVSRLLKLTSLF